MLRLDETILTETPPLQCCYGRIGHQVCIPLTGKREEEQKEGREEAEGNDGTECHRQGR